MAINLRKLKPAETVQLLNSSPLGAVLTIGQLTKHRQRAGLRIGDGKTIDLFRYAAWLFHERRRPIIPPDPPKLAGYEAIKEQSRHRRKQLSLSGRDIGDLPAMADPDRWARCREDLKAFLVSYFPEAFPLPFCADHEKVIAKIQTSVMAGGLFAIAMPRGSGKSTITERAALWALLYGHRRYVVLISAEAGLAKESLESIESELENNDLLLDDFPDVCYPIRCLEGIHQRAAGQLYKGERTLISLTDDEIVLPTIAGSVASGAIIKVAGITGRIRGLKATTTEGTVIRPDLVLVDDPQTDESARSVTQCEQRERVIKRAILGLAGPGKRIAGLAAVTVIQQGDLADRLLDREKHPQWQGERTRAVYQWPKNDAPWREYVEFRKQAQRDHDGDPEAVAAACNAFYAARRAEMDEGAEVAWPERKEDGDLSALQHCWNIRADRGDAAFMSEYQNDPLPEIEIGEDQLTADALEKRLNGLDRGTVPVEASQITAMIDVQAKALFWLVAAWEGDFSGYVLDYGTEPDQGAAYFSLSDLRRTLQQATPNAGLEGQLYAGLERLTDRLLGSDWYQSGAAMRISRCLVDANWGQSTDLVYKFCRQSRHAAILIPSHGRYVGAASKPINDYQRKPGDRVGLNWRIPVGSGRDVRHVLFDANYWKSFVRSRLQTPMGDPGALTFYGHDAARHRLLIDHLLSEHSIRTEGRGRQVDEWRLRASGLDNHWWDCLIGSAVAASMLGVSRSEAGGPMEVRRRKASFAAMQAARR